MKRDLREYKFGRLSPVEATSERIAGNVVWICACDCGNTVRVGRNNLTNKHIQSCGCLRKEKRKTHGGSSSQLYLVWKAIINRCENPKDPAYLHYGGRNIGVSEELKDFDVFRQLVVSLGYVESKCRQFTVDREDNDKGYTAENIRIVDMTTQSNNRRNNRIIEYNGETRTLAEWSRLLNIKSPTINARLRRGWSVERALSTPV